MNESREGRIWKWAGLALAAVIVSAAVTGCGGARAASTSAGDKARESGSAFPVTVKDDAGRSVTIDRQPERIVSLAPANTEILYSLGLLDKVVGVTTFDDYPAQVKDIAKVGDFTTPNMEAIAGAKPDLVLATTGVQGEAIAKLEQLGAKVVAVDPQSLEATFLSIEMVGKATGRTDKANEVVASMRSDLEAIQQRIGESPATTTFVEIAQEPLYTAGAATLIDDLITSAGGENVVTENGYVAYSMEQLVKSDPEVYMATKGSMSDPKSLAKRPGYSKLRSVKDGRVVVLEDNLVSRPGPRIVQGVLQIAKALHPDAFKD